MSEQTATVPTIQPIPEGLAERAALLGGPEGTLTDEQIRDFVAEQLAGTDYDGKSVCLIIPDGTRSVPLPKVLPAIHDALAGRASSVTVLIALGTHAAMSEEAIDKLLGSTERGAKAAYPEWTVVNHAWDDPEQIADLG
ncbi:MAG: lactate racemase domain-containing protein, partial [Brachybacterium tyrofermentans]